MGSQITPRLDFSIMISQTEFESLIKNHTLEIRLIQLKTEQEKKATIKINKKQKEEEIRIKTNPKGQNYQTATSYIIELNLNLIKDLKKVKYCGSRWNTIGSRFEIGIYKLD